MAVYQNFTQLNSQFSSLVLNRPWTSSGASATLTLNPDEVQAGRLILFGGVSPGVFERITLYGVFRDVSNLENGTVFSVIREMGFGDDFTVVESLSGFSVPAGTIIEQLGPLITFRGDGLLYLLGPSNVFIGSPNAEFVGAVGLEFKDSGSEDVLIGSGGNDTFIVDNTKDSLQFGPGVQRVFALIDYTLPDEIENLVLFGDAKVGIGNELDNTIFGNEGDNVLDGLAGNDSIDGGSGADEMDGGIGNDTFIVDNVRDVVIEGSAANSGVDTIRSRISITALAANVENLDLTVPSGTSSTAIIGTGNGLANTIAGNNLSNILSGLDGADTLRGLDGNDRLDGGPGNDRLEGGLGNDTYVFKNAGTDRIFDQGGSSDAVEIASLNRLGVNSAQRVGDDLVLSITRPGLPPATDTLVIEKHFVAANTVENLTDGVTTVVLATGLIGGNLSGIITGTSKGEKLDGQGGDDLLFGDAGRDKLLGGDGDDLLDGGLGSDDLIGGLGRDTFRFRLGEGKDKVKDFEQGIDTIALDRASFGIADGVDLADILQIGRSKPLDGLAFHLDGKELVFDADWGDKADRVTVATISGSIPLATDFVLV